MKYSNGIEIKLGDIISINIPDGYRSARVVMLGDTREHLELEETFLSWVQQPTVLDESKIRYRVDWRKPFRTLKINMTPTIKKQNKKSKGRSN